MQKPLPAYKGAEPYVFVCYAHADVGAIYPEIRWLNEQGVRVWYDEGISGGKVWRAEIAEAIRSATCVLYYISKASLASDHCAREVDYALKLGSTVLPIYLERVDLPAELDLALNRIQAFDRASPSYRSGLLQALGALESEVAGVPAPSLRRRWPIVGAATVLAVAAAGAWWGWRQPDDGQAPQVPSTSTLPYSVTVLPLDNLSENPELSALAKVVVADLNRELTGTDLDVLAPQVAASPDVKSAFVVKGHLRPDAADSVRVSLQLIRTDNGQIVATDESVEVMGAGRFARAPYVARRVEADITDVLWVDSSTELGEEGRYLFLAALLEWNRILLGARSDWRVYVEYLTKLVQVEPTFEWGHFFLANAYKNRLGQKLRAAEALPLAHEAIRKLLALRPDNTFVLGQINTTLDLDYEAAMANLEHARDSMWGGFIEYDQGLTLFASGRLTEALSRFRAASVAGTNQDQAMVELMLGFALLTAGRYREALQSIETSLGTSASPRPGAQRLAAQLHFLVGDQAGARRLLDESWKLYGQDDATKFADLLALLGETERARDILEQSETLWQAGALAEAGYSMLGHIELGDFDRAFLWWDRTIDNREWLFIGYVRSSTRLEAFRADPRYASAMVRLAVIESTPSPTTSVATAGLERNIAR